MISFAIAYLLAGGAYVFADLQEPYYNRPSYLRSNKGIAGAVLLWPLALLMVGATALRCSPPLRNKFIGKSLLPPVLLFSVLIYILP